jgi:plastocyanin
VSARPCVAAAIATCALLAVPTAAQAAAKVVYMGVPLKSQKKLQDGGADVNAYFPHSVTIRAGDTVKFRPVAFHTVNLPPRGGGLVPLVEPTGTVTGVIDTAGTPFWFNGQDRLEFNFELVAPTGYGKRFSYNANTGVNSGLPTSPRREPMSVKFPTKGKYTYLCDVHPGMKGQVIIKGRNATVPSAKQDKQRLKNQISQALKRAKKLPSIKPPANTAYVGGSANGGVEYFGMLPATLTVPVNTTVTFSTSPRSYETHTATFGPGPRTDPTSYLGQIAASFPVDPRGAYPSDAPGAPVTFTSALHGNGFWNSGALDRASATPQLASATVRFGAAGTYDYYCLLHAAMHGRVIVTP